ncbi:hypothetical protein H6762_01035 [Candidatus Nomurabacteria bacterium]|nr:hypothetical protein [Candidatus Nomurabacteria bacterium]
MKKILIGVIAIIVIGITTFLVEFIITYQKTAVNLQAAIENYDIKTVSEYLPGIKTTYIEEEGVYHSTAIIVNNPIFDNTSFMLITEKGSERYEKGYITTNIDCNIGDYPPKSAFRSVGISPLVTLGKWTESSGYDDIKSVQRYMLLFEPTNSDFLYTASCSEETNTLVISLDPT